MEYRGIGWLKNPDVWKVCVRCTPKCGVRVVHVARGTWHLAPGTCHLAEVLSTRLEGVEGIEGVGVVGLVGARWWESTVD